MTSPEVLYSIGFNFDPSLIDGLICANEQYGGRALIDEVFGALPDSPIPSARPTSRIPRIGWEEFEGQVETLRRARIEFNFLMNTAHRPDETWTNGTLEYLNRLADVGVSRLTVGSLDLCRLVKRSFPNFHVTMSITYGANSQKRLSKAEAAGADAIYLDGVSVNRNFELLRSLREQSKAECRLYANMSCISHCPVVRQHYSIFAGTQTESTALKNDAFFAGCTLIKLANPVEWVQMPWIRPEDIEAYSTEGISHFKLTDRLAPTDTLLAIAHSYLRGESPEDLFALIERDGSKYKMLMNSANDEPFRPMSVLSDKIPSDFIEHFRSGACISNDVSCEVCLRVALQAVRSNMKVSSLVIPTNFVSLIPAKLLKRRQGRLLGE